MASGDDKPEHCQIFYDSFWTIPTALNFKCVGLVLVVGHEILLMSYPSLPTKLEADLNPLKTLSHVDAGRH